MSLRNGFRGTPNAIQLDARPLSEDARRRPRASRGVSALSPLRWRRYSGSPEVKAIGPGGRAGAPEAPIRTPARRVSEHDSYQLRAVTRANDEPVAEVVRAQQPRRAGTPTCIYDCWSDTRAMALPAGGRLSCRQPSCDAAIGSRTRLGDGDILESSGRTPRTQTAWRATGAAILRWLGQRSYWRRRRAR